MRQRFLLLALFAGLLAGEANAQKWDQPNLTNWYIAADVVGAGDIGGTNEYSDGLHVREFEVSANSQIDQTWEGVFTFTIEEEIDRESGTTQVHEAFLFSPSLFERSTVKLGKFFLGFGRLNRIHRHDWAFTDAPLFFTSFFGPEGTTDTGAEYTALAGGSLNWKTTIGLSSGRDFAHSHAEEGHEEEGHEHEEEGQPYTPTGYMRISSFKEISTTEGFETGLNFIVRNDHEGTRFHYAGVDFIYKKRVARYLSHMFEAEVWSRTAYLKEDNTDGIEDVGAYFYYQKGFNRHHSLGFRYDFYNPDLANGEQHREVSSFQVSDHYNSYSLVYTYYNSEFMRARFTLEQSNGLLVDDELTTVTAGLLQLVFMIGAHPAHLY